MKIKKEINFKEPMLAFQLVNKNKGIVVINKEIQLIQLDDNNTIIAAIELPEYLTEDNLKILVSNNEKYAVIYNQYKQFAALIDLNKVIIIKQLDRKKYCIEHCSFPLAFFEENNQTYLVYAEDWNVLQILHVESLDIITERKIYDYDKETENDKYVDYFHSKLQISPNNTWIISNGWVWHPVAILKGWNLQNWKNINAYEVETNAVVDEYIGGYSWDRPLAWISENEFIYFAHTGEEEIEGLEKCSAYLRVYNMQQNAFTRNIKFDGFKVNEYYECLSGANLFFCDDFILSSCPSKGTQAICLDEHEDIIYHNADVFIREYHSDEKIFIEVKESKVILY